MPDRELRPKRAGRTFPRLAGLALLGILVAVVALAVLNRRVNRALEAGVSDEQPVELVALPERSALVFWSGEDIESVVASPEGIYVAGAFGVARLEPTRDARVLGFDRVDISTALPTRRVAAMSSWRNDLVAGPDFGGLFDTSLSHRFSGLEFRLRGRGHRLWPPRGPVPRSLVSRPRKVASRGTGGARVHSPNRPRTIRVE